jgi:cellulose synthase/poly-beta-1,6-N-acetylglucosamine synthase-like glycosyltransferase
MVELFWLSLLGSVYAYFGYPLILWGVACILGSRRGSSTNAGTYAPPTTILIPVHNEGAIIGRKVENTLALDYGGKLEVIVISDGSTDDTVAQLESFDDHRLRIVDLRDRGGKARALNEGLAVATGEIIVFSDASILLDQNAIAAIVKPFADPRIGCVSGEDYIEGGGGEGLYGRYELFLRNLESRLGSIVGASGSFYAQRRGLVNDFGEGLAPDFLSVLATIEKGYRAISTPAAFGYMTALTSTRDEFRRKVRTIVRGMAALFSRKRLLNPFKHPAFAFCLWSHKVVRWCVPFFLLGLFVGSLALVRTPFYGLAFVGQVAFYVAAGLAHLDFRFVATSAAGRIPLYFVAVNAAIVAAWWLFISGVRQELWAPTKRQP